MLLVGLPPCSIPSTTGCTCHNYDGKKPIKTENGAKCRAGMMPALHNRWGLWRVGGKKKLRMTEPFLVSGGLI